MKSSCNPFNHVTDKKYIISADFLIWEINICHRTSLPSKCRVFKAVTIDQNSGFLYNRIASMINKLFFSHISTSCPCPHFTSFRTSRQVPPPQFSHPLPYPDRTSPLPAAACPGAKRRMDPSALFEKISYGTEINRGQERRNFTASLSPR